LTVFTDLEGLHTSEQEKRKVGSYKYLIKFIFMLRKYIF